MKLLIKQFIYVFASLLFILSCSEDDEIPPELKLVSLMSGETIIYTNATNINIPINGKFTAEFNLALDTIGLKQFFFLTDENDDTLFFTISCSSDRKTVSLSTTDSLAPNSNYKFIFLDEIQALSGDNLDKLSILFTTKNASFSITNGLVGDISLLNNSILKNIPLSPVFQIDFSRPLNTESVTSNNIRLFSTEGSASIGFTFQNENKTLIINANENLSHLSKYTLSLSTDIFGVNGEQFTGFSKSFYTQLDSTYKFPTLTDDELLTLIQRQTFKYFWDFGHPVSGMTRERNTSGDVVATGGSGFGIMAIIVGVERGFISRAEGLERLETIITFLSNADRFHGAWPHWLNGSTGNVIPFSSSDNGGDLVETSYMAQGLISVRQYLNAADGYENALINNINSLLNTIEWSWYTKGDEDVLYWHWSPTVDWSLNMQIKGYNEALITYFMAATSSAYPVDSSVYHNGWAGSSYFINGRSFFGITLPLGYDYGGPLFFAHYSFVGLDPRNLNDMYANYWQQNTNHTLINRAYCQANPKNYIAYGGGCWGLTASDNQSGYNAHSPTNDLGVITPTAAISSIPYTPTESMEAIHYFYYLVGDRLWGEYGFYDAFNVNESWWASSYLAIDQGPIILMIENYRTGLLWDLFMSAPEVQQAMDKLSFIN